VAERPKVLAC